MAWIPQQVGNSNPSIASFQNTQQARDNSPGLDVRHLSQPHSGASNVQQIDISTKKHELIAQQPQQQHSAVHSVQRQSKSPAQYMESSNCQAVQGSAPSHHSILPSNLGQAMSQSHSHMAQQQLPTLHTTSNPTAVQPSQVNVAAPLPTEQTPPMAAVAQQLVQVQHHQQLAQVEQLDSNISQIQQPQTLDTTQQYASIPGADIPFQNQQRGINMGNAAMYNESNLNIPPTPQQTGVKGGLHSNLQNHPSASIPLQNQQNNFSIQPAGQDYSQVGMAAQQPININVEQKQSIQPQTNIQQIAKPPQQSVVQPQNIAMINLQQRSTLVQQPPQLTEQNNVQVRTTISQSQQNSLVPGLEHANINVQHPSSNQDQHLQNLRILPNASSYQVSGDMIPAKVYVANQTSGNMSEINSSQLIQQTTVPEHHTKSGASSNVHVPLQQQTSVQMQGGMSNYVPNDPNQSLRQIQQQPSVPQMQQPAQARQFIQQAQQQPVQALTSQQIQMQQSIPTIQQQQPQTLQHQRNQNVQQASQINTQQSSSTPPVHGVQPTPQHAQKQTTPLQQQFQQVHIQQKQTNISLQTHDQPSNIEISPRVDRGIAASQPAQYGQLGGSSLAGSTAGPSNQQLLQQSGVPMPLKQASNVGANIQSSTRDGANISLPPSRADQNLANYGIKPQVIPQQSVGAAVHIEKINMVKAQQITVNAVQQQPLDVVNSIDNKTIVGEQLMDRLEQISRTQVELQTTHGDIVDTER